ncbi:MAG: hypothetical protein OEV72_04270 [Thermoleophilia bacterium]|nr:hypothetical protein [Thermoleophilia bacterium]
MSHVSPPRPGDLAPPLELPSIDGDVVGIADLRGRVVLASFLRHAG